MKSTGGWLPPGSCIGVKNYAHKKTTIKPGHEDQYYIIILFLSTGELKIFLEKGKNLCILYYVYII